MSEHQVNQGFVTLLSDFGDRDVYVAVMKGVIAQINPQLRVIDLVHHIPPQDIAVARFCLMNAYPYFPQGTVHLAVVDPGVGSTRKAIAVQCAGGFLVGPDNGLFSGVLAENPAIAAVELTNPQYWRTYQPSKTFHGRDIFASVAAHLASGVTLQQLGIEIDPNSLIKFNIDECNYTNTSVTGSIQYIDYFGNLVSNIPGSCVQDKKWCVQLSGKMIPGNKTYSDVGLGQSTALVGSHGWVEIAINGGNAHLQMQINLRDRIEVLFLDQN